MYTRYTDTITLTQFWTSALTRAIIQKLRHFLILQVYLVFSTFVAISASAHAEFISPKCDSAEHRAFDFWLGDWQVIDFNSKQLVAFDRVTKQLKGCLIQQELIWLTDQFRDTDLNFRLQGKSFSSWNGAGYWQMLWVDVHGGSLYVRGTVQADGSLEFKTIEPAPDGRHVKAVWIKNQDGTIRHTGYSKNGDSGSWSVYFDWLYVPNR